MRNRLLELGPLLAPRLVRELANRPLGGGSTADASGALASISSAAGRCLGLRRSPHPATPEAVELSVEDEEGLLHLWRARVLELRTVHTRMTAQREGALTTPCPDRLLFALDPGPDTPWPRVLEVAASLRASLDAVGLVSLLKTSGARGLHVVVPVAPAWPAAALVGIAEAAVARWGSRYPSRIAPCAGPRAGRVAIDPRRNAAGATMVAAYSLRAAPPWGVSMPVRWNELGDISAGDHWTLGNLSARLLALGELDPWAGQGRLDQSLDRLARSLGLPLG